MNIALIGYGKMGKAIEQIALQKQHTIGLIIDQNNSSDLIPENVQSIDVIIEFTRPESAFENIQKSILLGKPVISGTTGWLDKITIIEELTKKINGTFIYSSNFSIGVNLFFELNRKFAILMKNYESYQIKMEEIHHTEKKDTPSGTAISLAQSIIQENKNYKNWTIHQEHPKTEIYIESKRKGDTPGTHIVQYTSIIDDLEIKHTAHNRIGFAQGVVLAAEFANQNKGIFSMKDVLNL